MKLTVRTAILRFLRAVQRATAQVVLRGAPRVPHPDARGPVGGSLAQDVLRSDLVRASRAGGTFTPSRLGLKFRLWWNGSDHQRARGRDVPIDEDALVRALEEDLAKQVRALDQRSS